MEDLDKTHEGTYGSHASHHQVHAGVHYTLPLHAHHFDPEVQSEHLQMHYPTIGHMLSSGYRRSLVDDTEDPTMQQFSGHSNDQVRDYDADIGLQGDPNDNLDGMGLAEQYMERMYAEQGGKGRRKMDKEMQLNTCLAVGCDRQIRQRRLCPMHQKQKERSGGKLDLKVENVKFAKGRTPTPFSKHANKYAKLKTFDKKIDEWAGGKEEGTKMLEAYIESSYHQNRFPKLEDTKIFEHIGRNIIEFMKQLPEKSPLRRPLIKAMSDNVPLARLREVLPVSKQTVINSKKLHDSDNLLLTIKYRPGVNRGRKRSAAESVEMGETEVATETDEAMMNDSALPSEAYGMGSKMDGHDEEEVDNEVEEPVDEPQEADQDTEGEMTMEGHEMTSEEISAFTNQNVLPVVPSIAMGLGGEHVTNL
ncbi:hypothetical protein PROFUN_14240 [Planoprotostelium fungivorum]|uniref:Uncharacterized protein n=1 Tax=Planoprotostelium fungivorum TaxID=1890364 RepID=A0A2P6N5N9_9EUKA|nr:hypothetical protein PROFUN_14240 [Planoprotostelium fungivorum]